MPEWTFTFSECGTTATFVTLAHFSCPGPVLLIVGSILTAVRVIRRVPGTIILVPPFLEIE
jgi:xanthine/uracil/vitamin C permease (AzgA family)